MKANAVHAKAPSKILVLIAMFVGWLSVAFATQYTYDDLGRITKVSEPDGSMIQYTFDSVGNVTSINRTGPTGTFGLRGYIQATMMGSCAWHFIGSMAVNVYPISCKKVRIVVTNNSSFTSFTYGKGPSWNGGPGGNFHQTYEWEESL